MSTEAPSTNTVPPKPPQGSQCWIEIYSTKPAKLKDFYAGIFPAWNFKPAREEYEEDEIAVYMFDEPEGLGAAILKFPYTPTRPQQDAGIGTTIYYFVSSLSSTQNLIHELGGTTVVEKKSEGNSDKANGWYMNFRDPEGNRFACYETSWEGENLGWRWRWAFEVEERWEVVRIGRVVVLGCGKRGEGEAGWEVKGKERRVVGEGLFQNLGNG